jgi:hypothetical protein
MTLPPAELGPDHDGASSLMIRLAFIEPLTPARDFVIRSEQSITGELHDATVAR